MNHLFICGIKTATEKHRGGLGDHREIDCMATEFSAVSYFFAVLFSADIGTLMHDIKHLLGGLNCRDSLVAVQPTCFKFLAVM